MLLTYQFPSQPKDSVGSDNPHFRRLFSDIFIYQVFLQSIVSNYEHVRSEIANTFTDWQAHLPNDAKQITGPEQKEFWDKIKDLNFQLHLCAESYYIFAKLVLDKSVRSFWFYYGMHNTPSLVSFNDFSKNHTSFLQLKNLPSFSADLEILIGKMKTVVLMRDQIVHEKYSKQDLANQRSTTIEFKPNGTTAKGNKLKISPNPGGKEHGATETLVSPEDNFPVVMNFLNVFFVYIKNTPQTKSN